MSFLTVEQKERFATLFSEISQNQNGDHQRKSIERKQSIVYNDDNRIVDFFKTLHGEFSEGKMDHVSIEAYPYGTQKTVLTEHEISQLFGFVRYFAAKVQGQSETEDITVFVKEGESIYEFSYLYQPTMPQYISKVDSADGENVVTFEEIVKLLPTKFPPRSEWTTRELFD